MSHTWGLQQHQTMNPELSINHCHCCVVGCCWKKKKKQQKPKTPSKVGCILEWHQGGARGGATLTSSCSCSWEKHPSLCFVSFRSVLTVKELPVIHFLVQSFHLCWSKVKATAAWYSCMSKKKETDWNTDFCSKRTSSGRMDTSTFNTLTSIIWGGGQLYDFSEFYL